LKKLPENGVLQGREEAVTVGSLMKFASSQVCRQAVSAKFILKELPFNMKMAYESGEEIVVQGVIDCLLGGSDGLHLYDYKTGHFRSGDAREAKRILETYGLQLELYARAAEMIYGEAPQEASVYMTRIGDVIRVKF
jgi:ATP-dependent helicase/nuclease subunit A